MARKESPRMKKKRLKELKEMMEVCEDIGSMADDEDEALAEFIKEEE